MAHGVMLDIPHLGHHPQQAIAHRPVQPGLTLDLRQGQGPLLGQQLEQLKTLPQRGNVLLTWLRGQRRTLRRNALTRGDVAWRDTTVTLVTGKDASVRVRDSCRQKDHRAVIGL